MNVKEFKKMVQSKNKYNSQKVTVGGETFDSSKEYRRFCELKLLQRAGKISDLQRQVKFVLIPTQREPNVVGPRGGVKEGKAIEYECAYFADFVYVNDKGETVVEDVKGYKKGAAYDLFSIKRKLMLYVHGIRVQET